MFKLFGLSSSLGATKLAHNKPHPLIWNISGEKMIVCIINIADELGWPLECRRISPSRPLLRGPHAPLGV
jgi:hypothetical protein